MFVVSALVGCGSLDAKYVEADRKTYEAIAPCISAGIESVGENSLKGRAWKLLYRSWDGRLDAAEEKVRGQ